MKRGSKTIRFQGKSRPPIERMLKIHHAVQRGRYPNATNLATEMEVSTKTIHRDLDFMRDRLDLPLEFCHEQNGFHYTEEVENFPTMQITEGELFALLVAEKALQQYRGTHFEKPLVSAFGKVANSLPDTISINLQHWDQSISFRTSAQQILDLEQFNRLAKATTRRRCLRFTYRKPGARNGRTREVDPWHLANIDGEWFLFGYCHLRKDIRQFAPARISELEETGDTFKPTRKFDLARRLKGSFGVFAGDKEYEVVIRFNELVADYIREKKWHKSQKLKSLPDGSVELSLRLNILNEVQRWVMGWGGNAVPIQPPELVDSVRKAATQILNATKPAPGKK